MKPVLKIFNNLQWYKWIKIMLLTTPLGFVNQLQVSVYFYMQSTPDNSNLQEKLKKVRVIGSLKQITGSKEISKWMGRECN